jgi:hypothetical protein
MRASDVEVRGLATPEEQNDEYGPGFRNVHRVALGHYNRAATFNAAGLVAVVFGQFGVLTLLEGRGRLLRIGCYVNLPIFALIFVYALILGLGCYFILNWLMFARFIEQLRICDGTRALTRLEDRMIDDIRTRLPLVTWLRSGRNSILRLPLVDLGACVLYLFFSGVILKAVLWLPVLGH